MIGPPPDYEPPVVEELDCDGEILATASMITGQA